MASPTIQQNATKRSHSNDTKTNESEDTHRNRTNPALVRQVAATGIGNRQMDSDKRKATGGKGESLQELTDRTPKGLAKSQTIFRDLDIDIGRESLIPKDQMEGGGTGSTSSVGGTGGDQTSSSLSNGKTTREDGDCKGEGRTRKERSKDKQNEMSNVKEEESKNEIYKVPTSNDQHNDVSTSNDQHNVSNDQHNVSTSKDQHNVSTSKDQHNNNVRKEVMKGRVCETTSSNERQNETNNVINVDNITSHSIVRQNVVITDSKRRSNSTGGATSDHISKEVEVATEEEKDSTHDSTKLLEEGVKVRELVHAGTVPNLREGSEFEIPREIQECLQRAHGSHRGHLGREATIRNLFEDKNFRRAALRGRIPEQMDGFINHWLQSCDTCQKMSVKRSMVQAEHFTCSVYQPMKRVAIDYIEKLTADRWGNDMIVVIIDCFSRFIVLYAVQSTRAKIFVDTFVKWISIFGQPAEVLSDQGSQFLSDIVQQLYDLTRVKSIITTPNSKQENAIVERANREVMRHLRGIVYDERVLREWSLHLGFVQRIMNSMVHSSTGLKPCQIVFGKDFSQELITSADGEESKICVLRLAKVTTDEEGADEALETVREEDDEEVWLKEMKQAQQVAIDVAREHLISKDMKHMMKAPKAVDRFEVGEMVLAEQGSSFRRGPNDKLLPFLAGPYEVIEVRGSEYILRNCITGRTKTIHLSNLTRYIQTQFHRAPAEAAMRDFSDVFMVERIVEGVRGNEVKGPVSALKFKVSWVGFPGEDTIEPWKEVRKLEVFKNFIENHVSKGYRDLAKKLSKEKESESGGDTTDEEEAKQGTATEERRLGPGAKKQEESGNRKSDSGSRKSERTRTASVRFQERDEGGEG